MEVALVADWPDLLWEITDHEHCALLVGREGEPIEGASVRATYFSSSLPGKKFVVSYVALVDNSAEDTTKDFAISKSEFDRVKASFCFTGLFVIGSVHTHPPDGGSEASKQDMAGIPKHLIGAVISPTHNTVRWYTRSED